MSPTVLRAGAYRFYFFSREEERPHVHVQHPDGEAKFWLEPELAPAQNQASPLARCPLRFGSFEGTKMKSALRGKITSDVEVTNVTPSGFWLLLDGRELFLAYEQFPWFEDATIREITSVERPSLDHLYWPILDVDLAVQSLEYPARFPLVSRAQSGKVSQRSRPPRRAASTQKAATRRPRR